MGAMFKEDEIAIKKAPQIPAECREYLSHHIRNGICALFGMALKVNKDPYAIEKLQEQILHIESDLEKVGL